MCLAHECSELSSQNPAATALSRTAILLPASRTAISSGPICAPSPLQTHILSLEFKERELREADLMGEFLEALIYKASPDTVTYMGHPVITKGVSHRHSSSG